MYGFADRLRKKGRFGDTLVAHLSEGEARFLRKMGGSGTTNPFTGAVEFYKGTMDGPVPSFYQSLLPDSNMEVAVDPEVEDAPRSGLDGFFKSIEKLQNVNKPKKPDSGLDPRMVSFAKIMQNTFDRDDPGTQGETRAEYYEGGKSIENMLKYTMGINSNLHDRLIDRSVDGQWNEDKAPGRVDEVISYMFRRNDDGINAFEHAGGKEAYIKALEEIGVTGKGKSYADRTVKGFIEGAESLAKALNQSQTSTTMGGVKGPQFAGSYKTFGEAKEAMFGPTGLSAVAKMLSPTHAFTNLVTTGITALTDPYTSWSDAIGRSFGFPDAQVGFRQQDVGFGIEDDATDDSYAFGDGGHPGER